MAKKDKDESNIRFGALKKIAGLLQNNTDDLYKSTYYSNPDNKKQLMDIKSSIDASIKNIISTTTNNVGEPNISRFYERIYFNTQNDSRTVQEFEKIFGDNEFINNLTSSYLDNVWIKSKDDEIDELTKYMPKLQEALNTLRDNVLSADSFSKDFLTLNNELTDSLNNNDQFSTNIKELKKTYKLNKLITEIYDDTSKYGETFIYCVPYDKAIQTLMDRKQNSPNIRVASNFSEGKILIENAIDGTSKSINTEIYKLSEAEKNDFNINIELSDGVIESLVINEKHVREKLQVASEQSIWEQYIQEAVTIGQITKTTYDNTSDGIELGKLPTHNKFDKTIDDRLELPDLEDTSADGLITRKNQNSKIKKMSECIVKKLSRERITPIILNDICLGYYYFEFDEDADFIENGNRTMGMVNTITGLRSNGKSEAFDAMQRREELLRYLSSELASKIDTKFINDNQDLKKEIYYILKYNDQYQNNLSKTNIRVTYIPPEDVHHIYFNLDEKTHRGISDLHLSLLPAKLWVAIYITNCIAVMTRSNDKRVYYVKQSVESNISKTLLKTINEIKKSNFGIRQVENINNVLNITGRFNDYIIPRSSDGSTPIEFEIMQGQQVEIKTELLSLLEESAINQIVPLELIQMRQSPDYATQLTMSNTKFLRSVYNKQSDFQDILSPLITKLYDVEFSSTATIEVKLPPPLFINVTNTNQLIVNTSDFCNSIVEIMVDPQNEPLKAKVGKNLKTYYLGSYLNISEINNIINKSKHELELEDVMKVEDGGEAY